jgi:tRNA-2-methylthio-N6-dimethylallyladenosine synthase
MVDLVVGPQTYHRLPKMMEARASRGEKALDTDFPEEDKFAHLPKAERRGAGRRRS